MVIRFRMPRPPIIPAPDRDDRVVEVPIEDGDEVEVQVIDADGETAERVIICYDRRLGLSLRCM